MGTLVLSSGLHLFHGLVKPLIHSASQSCTLRNRPDIAGEWARGEILCPLAHYLHFAWVWSWIAVCLRPVREHHACHWQREKKWPSLPCLSLWHCDWIRPFCPRSVGVLLVCTFFGAIHQDKHILLYAVMAALWDEQQRSDTEWHSGLKIIYRYKGNATSVQLYILTNNNSAGVLSYTNHNNCQLTWLVLNAAAAHCTVVVLKDSQHFLKHYWQWLRCAFTHRCRNAGLVCLCAMLEEQPRLSSEVGPLCVSAIDVLVTTSSHLVNKQ